MYVLFQKSAYRKYNIFIITALKYSQTQLSEEHLKMIFKIPILLSQDITQASAVIREKCSTYITGYVMNPIQFHLKIDC